MLPVANAKAYNSLWQFKADAWSSLEDAAVQLSLATAGKRSLERAADTATELLDVLGPIERLYAYPGTQEFSKVRRMFAAGKYDQFAAMVGEINRAFVTDSFRTGQVRNLGRVDQASDRDTHPGEQTGGESALFRGPGRRGHERAAGARVARGAAAGAPPGRPVRLRDRGGAQFR